MKYQPYLALAAVLCLAACGTPGAPRPPSLELPRPVSDLAATRQGDQVTLTWTVPRETTDKQNIRHPGPVRVCRGVNTTAMVECPQVAELPPAPAAAKGAKPEQRTYIDTPADGVAAAESHRVCDLRAGVAERARTQRRIVQPGGGAAGADAAGARAAHRPRYSRCDRDLGRRPSDRAPHLRSSPSLLISTAAPKARRAKSTWAAPRAKPMSGTNYSATFRDPSFEWEKTYHYRVAPVTNVAESGEAGPRSRGRVLARDLPSSLTTSSRRRRPTGCRQWPAASVSRRSWI